MATFPRSIKVGKTDAFEIDVGAWSVGEVVTSFTVTDEMGLVTIGDTQIDGYWLKVLCTGVAIGCAELHFEYATATRNDCAKVKLVVVADC